MAGQVADHRRFIAFLEARQADHDPSRDIRETVLSMVNRRIGIGYVRDNLDHRFGANLAQLFTGLVAADEPGFETCDTFLATGALHPDPEFSHKGARKLFHRLPEGADLLFFEPGLIASSESWGHAYRDRDKTNACLSFVFDDIAQYYMADYPNRLVQKLNSSVELTDEEEDRVGRQIARILASRITKYNAQPMELPPLPPTDGPRVLVVDQASADAATHFGRVTADTFDAMLAAALRENPDAQIIIKAHPDSQWALDQRLGYYDGLTSSGRVVVLRDPVNPYSVLDLVDKVYVGTSQMGFEALLAGKKVVTFGAPFFAGWGLTDDRQVIGHRSRPRRLADLFHVFFNWYSIYIVPGIRGTARLEDALDYIDTHRPVPAPVPKTLDQMTPRVSVIIPVYDVAPYLEDCIASVQRQVNVALEIILVNDASRDTSQEIIDRFAAADPRIRSVVLDQNSGQGMARNHGVSLARGDFIWFLDADDWLDRNDALARLVHMGDATGADMVRGKKSREVFDPEPTKGPKERADTSEAFFDREMTGLTYETAPVLLQSRHCWLWLYRRDWLVSEDIRFETPRWEERAFLVRALIRARSIACSTVPATAYRIRANSTARSARGAADFELMLTNFERTLAALADAGATNRAHPLRPHLEHHLSQFVDHILMAEPYRHFADGPAPEKAAFLSRLRARFERYDFGPADFVLAAVMGKKARLTSGAYELAIAALLAQRDELLETAVSGAPVAQDALYAAYLKAPETPATLALEAALNTFARNERVALHKGRSHQPKRLPKLVIHIGASKTGSTFLQTFFEANRPALLRAGIWYPEVGLFWQKDRPHKQAGHSFFATEAALGRSQLRDHVDQAMALLGDQIDTILLSSEAFFLKENAPQIADLFAGFDIRVIVYLRRQDHWANAQYAEFVAGGAVGRVDVSFDEWLEDPETRRLLDYRVPLEAWARKLGRDKVTVRLYEPDKLAKGDLVSDFADASSLAPLRGLPKPVQSSANAARLSRAHVELIRTFNARPFRSRAAYFAFIERATTALIAWRAARQEPTEKPMFLTHELSRRILEDAALCNGEIARDYLSQPGSALFSQEVEIAPAPDMALHADEVAIVTDAYEANKPPAPDDIALGATVSISRNQRYKEPIGTRVVNYGHFGWRLWLLTPIVDRLYVQKALPLARDEFLVEPAVFAREYWSKTTPFQVGLMYPNTAPLGLFSVWVPLVGAIIKRLNGAEDEARFRKAPILYMRRSPNRLARIIGRLLFPRGEVR